MRARIAYPLAFLVPIATAAALVGFFAAVLGGAVLWLFIYGDEGWSGVAETIVITLSTMAAIAVCAALVIATYRYGKQREPAAMRRLHLVVAVVGSILLPALLLSSVL